MCSCKSVCLRHWAFLGPCKNSPYNMPLAVTQMHCPACLPRAEQGQKRRGGAGREHPVGAVACFVCFLLQTVPWTWELQIYPLLPFTSRNSQSIFLGWRQVRGEECVLWEWTACHAPPAMSEAPGCSCPDLLRLSELHYSSHWFFFFYCIYLFCFICSVLFCLFICAWWQTSLCYQKALVQTQPQRGEILPWWDNPKVIRSAPAEANQANQEAPRTTGCVRLVVSTLRHFLLLF